ncbi:integrase, partial [Nocardiopsis tropica]|nr:integrase [Nocardiopsis tropica]
GLGGGHDRVGRGTVVHALRHRLGPRWAEDGASVTEILGVLGHASLSSSQAYSQVTDRAQREAAGANRTFGVLRRLGGGEVVG